MPVSRAFAEVKSPKKTEKMIIKKGIFSLSSG
jgi:hypothetical protein